jgi:predicted transcriptional regulator
MQRQGPHRSRRHRSKSYLAAAAIAAYLEPNDWQIAEIEAGIAELDSGRIVSAGEAAGHYDRLRKSL